MTRGQANLVGGAVVGAFFTAAAAGLVGFVMEIEGRDLSVRGEQRQHLTDTEARERHPPGFVEIGLAFLAGAGGGAVLGVCVVVITAPVLGRRPESRVIDAVGGLGGALLGACVGLMLTQATFLRRDDPWGQTITWFGVGAGVVLGTVQGAFFGAGVRERLMRRVDDQSSKG